MLNFFSTDQNQNREKIDDLYMEGIKAKLARTVKGFWWKG